MLTFEQFRSKLADVVTVAINSGKVVRPPFRKKVAPGCYCPLGCHPDSPALRPGMHSAPWVWGTSDEILVGFTRGFDGYARKSYDLRAWRLGRLYRRRFGGK